MEEVLQRRGAQLRTSTPVQAIESGIVRWKDGAIEADTIVLAAGDTRARIALDWTVSLFFRPDLTKVALAPEREYAPDGHKSRKEYHADHLSRLHRPTP